MKIQESGEMYLETILVLSQEKKNVRAIDIAIYNGYSKPSVSRAMKLLKEAGYILINEEGFITLTEEGRNIAETIYERHVILSDLFEKLGVSHQTAVDDACKIEHDISAETFEAIKRHLKSN